MIMEGEREGGEREIMGSLFWGLCTEKLESRAIGGEDPEDM